MAEEVVSWVRCLADGSWRLRKELYDCVFMPSRVICMHTYYNLLNLPHPEGKVGGSTLIEFLRL